jgi:hypothetical protein
MRVTAITLSALVLAALGGCTSLKSGTDVLRGASDGGVDATGTDGGPDCVDPTGFGGAGCYRCTPTTRDQLLTACTSASTEPFDESMRLPALPDGGVVLPAPMDAGVPMDAGPSDAGMPSDAGVGGDAGPMVRQCASLMNPVYVTGSSAVGLFLGQVAQALENDGAPITIVYRASGSCAGVTSMITPMSGMLTGTAIYWDPNPGVDPTSAAAQLPCALAAGGVQADIGFSDVFASTCQTLPSGLDTLGLHDFTGPIQTMNFVVPVSSRQRAISAEAAFLVYGFGGATYPVMPWTDATHILQRNASSGTQALIGATIGLPRDRWMGVPNASSSAMRDALLAAGMVGGTTADATIGILASDVLDSLRSNIRGLAYRHYGQPVAFYPDSTGDTSARDKRNVRDGHYPLFGPLHMIARSGASGMATSASVQRIVNVINGVEMLSGLNIVDIYAQRSLIPQCAMRVARTADGGDLVPFHPDTPCGCYYEELATHVGTPQGCTPCTRVEQCGTGQQCVTFPGQTMGYCE